MASAGTNHLRDLALYVIRPALAEARLMTEKHTRDAVYVVTLTEELCNIEGKIAAMEEAVQLDLSTASVQGGGNAAPADGLDAKWFRSKSCELDLRLRRVEQLSKIPRPRRKELTPARSALFRETKTAPGYKLNDAHSTR